MQLDDTYVCTEKKLCWGVVRHQRFTPKPHGFSSKSCFVRIYFKQQKIAQNIQHSHDYPKIDKPSWCSIQARNYGLWRNVCTTSDMIHQMRKLVWDELFSHSKHSVLGISSMDDFGVEIELQTFPKLFGFVFNPVSFWFMYGYSNGVKTCQAIVCEVNNTFGNRHLYALIKTNQTLRMEKGHALHVHKAFHVSPFFPTSGRYEFRFMNLQDRNVARITYFDAQNVQLITSISGQYKNANLLNWVMSLFKYGWFTLFVFIKIHWHALLLWIKGAIFHSEPKSLEPEHLNSESSENPKDHFSSNLNP